MGNRAVIAFGDKPDSIGIYLHWNGGPESVLAILDATKRLGHRDPMQDNYGIARMVQVIGNLFGGSLSVGIDVLKRLDTDNGDNGTYYVGPGFTIARRGFTNDDTTTFEDLSKEQKEQYLQVFDACLEFSKTPEGTQ